MGLNYYYIYETTNNINGKKYIGQHGDDSLDNNYLGSGTAILRAIKKYGKEHFSKKILEIVDIDNINEKEIEWIKKKNAFMSDNYYNMTEGGEGCRGIQRFGQDNPFYGKTHSEETKQKISEAYKGQKLTEYQLQKLKEGREKYNQQYNGWRVKGERNGFYGKTHSEESRRKISENNKGKQSRLGAKLSEETKKKISESVKKVVHKRKVQCIETGIIYESVSEAGRQMGLHHQSIHACCIGKIKHTGGYTWKHID